MKLLILLFLYPSVLFAKFDKDGPKIKDLALWVHKMPFDEIDGHTLISSKELVSKLTKILGEKKVKEFLKARRQFLVFGGNEEGFITFGFCHGFCDHYFDAYVNVSTGKVYICESIHEGKKVQRIWYSDKGKVELNNLTKENMSYCSYSITTSSAPDWVKTINAIPKELL